MNRTRAAPAAALLLLVGTLAVLPLRPVHATSVSGTSCSVFPSNNIWNTDISRLPINANSATWVASTTPSSGKLHPDFGGPPYGIPFNVVNNAHATTTFTFQYASESDPGLYPYGNDLQIEQGSDAHLLTINSDTCKLYETFATNYGGPSTAGSGAVFDLGSNQLRPAGWTSADAAGLPIFPGLVRADEVQAGFIGHAIRFTVHNTGNTYLWPARHQAGISDATLPPMGARFRLKANYDISTYGTAAQVVLVAFKHYGLIVADNGSDWYFQGTEDAQWNSGVYPQMIQDLKNVPASAFEAVDESSLMIDPNSAQAASGRTAAQSQPAPVGSRDPAYQSAPTTSPPPPRKPRAIGNAGAKPLSTSLSALSVAGNRLTNAAGRPVVLRGFNRSGTESACIQGWGIFDGPSDLASVQAIASWHANFVRVLLNEDCWLGINGVPSAYGGANYQSAIVNFVNLLNQHGIYVELSLIWGAPGANPAIDQPNAPDQDHSPAFWTSVATTFKSNPDVIFGVWGETTVSWSCFLNGCSTEATYGSQHYQTAGTQELVNAIRATGATQPIAVPGINYANDLSQWLAYEPTDSQHALLAEAHIYGNNACGAQNNGACLTSTIAPVAASVPVVFGETGETYDDSECTNANMQVILPWADAHGVGYASWTWDTWGSCSALIAGYDGTPNTTTPAGAAYGKYVHDHLLALFLTSRTASQGPPSIAGSRGATNPSRPAPTPPPR